MTWADVTKWVPQDATALILYAECVKSSAPLASTLEVRSSPRLPTMKILNVQPSGRQAGTVYLPIEPRTLRKAFQHSVTTGSFGTSVSLQLVGYTL